MTALASFVSFIDTDKSFKTMPAKRQRGLFEKFYQTTILCIRAFILENLKLEDKETLQQILKSGDETALYALGQEKIPQFEQKVEKIIATIKDAFIQEVRHAS